MVNILFDANDTPDICIGTDNFFTSKELANFTMNFFKEFGYNVNLITHMVEQWFQIVVLIKKIYI